jgi:hypothetical protein
MLKMQISYFFIDRFGEGFIPRVDPTEEMQGSRSNGQSSESTEVGSVVLPPAIRFSRRLIKSVDESSLVH